MKKISDNEIKNLLPEIPGWEFDGKKLLSNFTFKNFSESLSFVIRVGIIAEKLDHHPDILLHSWNQVRIETITHNANGLTYKDLELVKEINKITD